MSNRKKLRKTLLKDFEKSNDFKRCKKEIFKKRKMCYLKKINELIQKCNASVYMIICRKNKYYTYNFTKKKIDFLMSI